MTKKKLLSLFFFIASCFLFSEQAVAYQESTKLAGESRIRTYVYNPNEVFIFTGHYGYQSNIELAPDESVDSISIGDSTAWDIITSGPRIFIKPIERDATTNMTLITNKRIYLFELYAEEAENIRDEDLVFSARFIYPDTGGVTDAFIQYEENDLPDVENDPELYNFNYTITGSRMISPLKIFDDGEFTYLEFRNKNADIPAIFIVDAKGNESLVNYRVTGNYIVIERVSQQFTLRHGDDVACVFNEANPLGRKIKKKKKILGLF